MSAHPVDNKSRSRTTEPRQPLTRWIDGSIIVCLFLFAAFASHSIAVTQIAWLLGLVLWALRFAFYPRPRIQRTPLDYALLGFFILSGLSSVFSYVPIMSIGKMRAASLFTIVYLFCENVGSLRIARLLAITLIASCMINVVFTAGRMAIGRGVKVEGVRADSPLVQGLLHLRNERRPLPITNGDTVFEVDGARVGDPDELAAALAGGAGSGKTALVRIYRVEWTPTLEVPRGKLLAGTTSLEQLGISSWSRGRDWRATGFYGHWVTYAEVLQLIASLALGLFLVLPAKRSMAGLLLLLAIAGIGFALGASVTRASWVGFLISATVMLLLSASRRTIIILGACAIPLVFAGLFLLQQKRNVGFFDQRDQSITWRETVWREGFHLLVSKPRHMLVGVGIDSIKGHWREWGLFDHGRLPIGHMHSNLLEIALERGVPALIVWLLLLGLYARMLWRLLRGQLVNREDTEVNKRSQQEKDGPPGPIRDWMHLIERSNWIDRGIVLGALGGLAGFCTSGLVHYNWGDSEVVMIFYFIMGLALVVNREAHLSKESSTSEPRAVGTGSN